MGEPSAGVFGGLLPAVCISKLLHLKTYRWLLFLTGCIQPNIREPLLDVSIGRGSLLVVPFEAASWDDPEELFGSQGFRFSVDSESQMAVSFPDIERKDLLRLEEAAGDILPFFVVNGFDVAPVILRLLDLPGRIKR
jgi:hypothetical protein